MKRLLLSSTLVVVAFVVAAGVLFAQSGVEPGNCRKISQAEMHAIAGKACGGGAQQEAGYRCFRASNVSCSCGLGVPTACDEVRSPCPNVPNLTCSGGCTGNCKEIAKDCRNYVWTLRQCYWDFWNCTVNSSCNVSPLYTFDCTGGYTNTANNC